MSMSMAARNVGSATLRLKAGDVVSTESTHFDTPGRPGSYSAGAPARAFGVVLGPTRTDYFPVMWRGGTSMESHWKHLRLEPEDEIVPKQRQGEAAPAFRRRLVESQRQLVESQRQAQRAEQVAEGQRRRRHEQRVQRHDAAAPPELREGESNHDFKQRERRFRNRVRPTRKAAVAGAAARWAPQIRKTTASPWQAAIGVASQQRPFYLSPFGDRIDSHSIPGLPSYSPDFQAHKAQYPERYPCDPGTLSRCPISGMILHRSQQSS